MGVVAFNLSYIVEMLISIIGFCAPLKKRKTQRKSLFVLILTVLLFLVIEPFFYIKYYGLNIELSVFQALDQTTLPVLILEATIWFAMIWGMLIVFIHFYTESSMYESIYIFALSYGVQHIFFCVRMLAVYLSRGGIGSTYPPLYILCLAGEFFLSCFWFAKGAAYEEKYPIVMISATFTSIAMFGIVWGLSIVMEYTGYVHFHCIYAIVCCFFILINQREQMKREIDRMKFSQKEQLWEKTKLRYEMSKESIAVVNQHYHDMKHQLMLLSTMSDEEKRIAKLQDMESRIAAYDAVVRTDNEFLDTVLTEKKLICQSRQIAMSCIADGKQLLFMDELDLYTLFGNALDNAIEANMKLSDPEKRWISVHIQNKKGMLLVEIMNPYEGTLLYDRDHLPVTSKQDTKNHGFGTRSIQNIIEQYGGQMIIKAEDHKYLLRMIFPATEQDNERGI